MDKATCGCREFERAPRGGEPVGPPEGPPRARHAGDRKILLDATPSALDEARAKLEEMNFSLLNPHERALGYRLIALTAFGQNYFETAIEYFEKTVEQASLPIDQEASVRFNIAQLHAALEQRQAMLRRVGILFQSGALWSSMTLAENVSLPLEVYTELSRSEIREIALFKLALVGLAGFGDFHPSEVSGGMQKRVGVARARAAGMARGHDRRCDLPRRRADRHPRAVAARRRVRAPLPGAAREARRGAVGQLLVRRRLPARVVLAARQIGRAHV